MAVDYNNILMIYIPRNGCTCIPFKRINGVGENEIINNARNFKLSKEGRFDTLLELKSKIDVSPYNKITIVRNPYTRTYSLYKRYLALVKLSQQDKSFLDFLNTIKNNRPYHPVARGLLHRTQSWFVLNESNQIEPSIKVYKFENLQELRTDLEIENYHTNRIHFNSIEEILALSYVQEGNALDFADSFFKNKSYSTTQRREAYTQQCIDLVQEIYSQDFDNFNYSRNIDDII